MTSFRRALALGLAAGLIVGAGADPPAAAARRSAPTLFVAVDATGTLAGERYDDAMAFLAWYVHGRVNGLGGLPIPGDLVVTAVNGTSETPDRVRSVEDFAGRSVAEIEADLRTWFPPGDGPRDFTAFFRRVARTVAERHLVLTPITVLVLTDGVPGADARPKRPAAGAYREIDLRPLDYLARRVTVRLAWTSPPVAERWRTLAQRARVRLWTVDQEVMKSWRAHLAPDTPPAGQDRLWQWVRETLDVRVRRGT